MAGLFDVQSSRLIKVLLLMLMSMVIGTRQLLKAFPAAIKTRFFRIPDVLKHFIEPLVRILLDCY